MKKILVVDDEASFRSILNKELTRNGYKVFEAKDGKEGYKKAIETHPNLIILDILMQAGDGLTMLERLRATKEEKSVKVIFLTNLELDAQVMKRAMRTKPLFYFVKTDTSLSSLLSKIDEELTTQ